MWYFLWSLGLPNFMPDYIISIFKPPISEFGKLIINFPNVKIFLYSLLIYFGILLVSIFVYLIENKKRIMEFFFNNNFFTFWIFNFYWPNCFLPAQMDGKIGFTTNFYFFHSVFWY